jgi:transposase
LKDWFPEGDFVFMHDGAPCHKAKSITKFFAEKDVKTLPWPGYSPDIKPIENVWGIVKKRLKKINITTKISFGIPSPPGDHCIQKCDSFARPWEECYVCASIANRHT